MEAKEKDCLYLNLNLSLCDAPNVKKHGEESPESKSELARKSFFGHKTHLFVGVPSGSLRDLFGISSSSQPLESLCMV